jgi:hypothetical protein
VAATDSDGGDVPDLGSVAAPVGFLTALLGLLGYLTKGIVSDRAKYSGDLAEEQARTQRAEAAAARAREDADAALAARRAADMDLATAEAELEGLRARIQIARQEKEWAWRELGRLRSAHVPTEGPLLPDPPGEGEAHRDP